MTQSNCLCGSGQAFTDCCEPYINGNANAPTAEKLMRSRFCAFAAKNKSYLLKTWLDSSRPEQLDLNKDDSVWTHMEIIDVKKGGAKDSKGLVEFKAFFLLDGKEHVMHEYSRFTKNQDCWYYLDGKVKAITAVAKQVIRGKNAPCHCGSGKKFKRCCGKTNVSG